MLCSTKNKLYSPVSEISTNITGSFNTSAFIVQNKLFDDQTICSIKNILNQPILEKITCDVLCPIRCVLNKCGGIKECVQIPNKMTWLTINFYTCTCKNTINVKSITTDNSITHSIGEYKTAENNKDVCFIENKRNQPIIGRSLCDFICPVR